MGGNPNFRKRETLVRISAQGVMARAWAIFRETYRYPAIPFRSIGRRCFAWALRKAWSEARLAAALAATLSAVLQTRIDRIEAELATLKYRCFSTNITKLETELRAEARPLIAELFRRSVEASAHRLAA